MVLVPLRFPDHVRHGLAGGDEGDDVRAIRNHHVEDIGFVGVEHPLHGGAEVFLEHHALAFHAEGIADAHVVGINLRAMVGITEVSVTTVAAIEVILPLHDHAEVLVVQDDGLGGNLLDVRGGELLDVHQEGAVAVNVHDLLVGQGDLHAQRGGIAVAHGAEAATGRELAGILILIPLTRPHLMLADAGGDVGLALGHVIKRLDDHLLQDDFAFLAAHVVNHVVAVGNLGRDAVGEGRFLLPFGDLREPGGVLLLDGALGNELVEAGQGVLDVADDGEVGLAVLVQLGGVNVNVDNGAVLAEFLELAGHAVVKAHAEREQEVGAVLQLDLRVVEGFAELVFAVHRPVGGGGTVHAEPAQRERMRLGKTADAHERGRHGDVRGLGELLEFRRRAAGDDAAADIEHGALGLLDEADDFVERDVVGFQVGLGVAAQTFLDLGERRPDGLRLDLLDVLGEINDDRAGASRLRDVKGFLHDARNIVDVRDEITVLHDGQRQADHVRFLKRAAANHGLRDLAGDGDERTGIHVGVGDGGDEIRRAGAAGAHAHAGLAGDARIAFGGETAALLVARENSADLGVRERLVDFHARAAGIGEDDLDVLAFKRLDKDVAAEHGRADFGAGLGGRFRFRFGGCSCFAHVFLWLWRLAEDNKKPTAMTSRGFLLKFQFNKHRRRRQRRRLPD